MGKAGPEEAPASIHVASVLFYAGVRRLDSGNASPASLAGCPPFLSSQGASIQLAHGQGALTQLHLAPALKLQPNPL